MVWVVGKSVKQLLYIYIYGLGSGNKFRICSKRSELLGKESFLAQPRDTVPNVYRIFRI
jgi:hypothetical protein